MNDYRASTSSRMREALSSGREKEYVRWGLPEDRRGLIAAFHAQCMVKERHVAAVNAMAKETARRTGQRVYLVMTESRWHLLLFALDDGQYDCEEEGEFANDQFVGYYDPDGSWTFVSAS